MNKRTMIKYLLMLFSLFYTNQAFAQIGWGPATNLGPNINTSYTESGASISTDSSKLYFSSRQPGGVGDIDIWVSEYINGWQTPVCLDTNVNSIYGEYEPCISRDGTKLFFSSIGTGGGYGFQDIWLSRKIGGVWQRAVNLGSNINSSSNEFCPFLTADTMQLYFVSERPGGYGGEDIWVSTNVGGSWQPPTNIGGVINTSGSEYSVSLSPDGQILYFGSTRAGGYGSCDIWQSSKYGGNWQSPMNLGPNINTSHQEYLPVVSSNGDKLYFTADSWTGGFGDGDIWLSNFIHNIEENTANRSDEPKRPTIIRGSLKLPQDKECKVFDICGRTADPLMLEPGIYFIEIEGIIAQKVIKVR